MGFETVVLDKVAAVLGTDSKAEFFNGTLFVEAEEKDARRVFTMLRSDSIPLYNVLMSKAGDQYAYDFI